MTDHLERRRPGARTLAVAGAMLLFGAATVGAQDGTRKDTTAAQGSSKRDTTVAGGDVDAAALRGRFELYGFGQADLGFDFKRSDPNWYDVNRPSKLPSFDDEFGRNGNSFVSVRQSRLGAKAAFPTRRGEVFANFDFDMYGVGNDAGQTTIRLRHAYGEWNNFGAGQLESQFMDLDVFPNILDYWGPNGMLFFRNAQVYWKPIDHGETRFSVALERPGASGDAGVYRDRLELENVKPRFPVPDLSAAYRTGAGWGYWRIAGIVRDIHWDQTPTDTFDLSGSAVGWGLSTSSNLKFWGSDVLRLQLTYGEGIQNYFNDAPADIGAERQFDNRRTPLDGVALPIFGAVAFLDHSWSETFTSSLGWSMVDIDNSDAQAPNAYKRGHYAIANLLYTPVTNVMMGAEYQFGSRENHSDDFTFTGHRLQFSFKYSFSQTFGGKP